MAGIGWLPTEKSAPVDAIADDQVREAIAESVSATLKEFGAPSLARLEALLDPNDWRVVERDEVGARYTPLTTDNHQRVGARERLLSVSARHPDRLHIELNALATRVVFDDGNRAVGVEYLKGERLYAADPGASAAPGELRTVRARREVILAGGAFNTPQLLMLSGIGDPDVLAQGRRAGAHFIARSRPQPSGPLRSCRSSTGWRGHGRCSKAPRSRTADRAVRASGPATGAVSTRPTAPWCPWCSDRRPASPSRICSATRVLADFRGYQPGYSELIRKRHDCLTWVVLKGHTNNRGGWVRIVSANPRVRPEINFRYFEEGTDGSATTCARPSRAFAWSAGCRPA